MGCGQARSRGAESPRDEPTASDRIWDAKGKLPTVVMKGWAKAMKIPYINPNRRIAPGKKLISNLAIELTDDIDSRPYDMQIANITLPAIDTIKDVSPHSPSIPFNINTAAVPTEQEEHLALRDSPNTFQLAQEDSDSENQLQGGNEERRRLARLEREKEAEVEAAKAAAMEREALEMQQRAQAEQLEAQKNLADAIMAKYT